jgi:hypothetical protein
MKFVEPENLKRMANVVAGKVVNISVWDGVSAWEPDEGEAVEIPEGVNAGIDWDYVDGEFVDNRPVETFDEE